MSRGDYRLSKAVWKYREDLTVVEVAHDQLVAPSEGSVKTLFLATATNNRETRASENVSVAHQSIRKLATFGLRTGLRDRQSPATIIKETNVNNSRSGFLIN